MFCAFLQILLVELERCNSRAESLDLFNQFINLSFDDISNSSLLETIVKLFNILAHFLFDLLADLFFILLRLLAMLIFQINILFFNETILLHQVLVLFE